MSSSFQGYDYNPFTGTYIRNPNLPIQPNSSHAPPRPPKPNDLIKETHGAAELEGSEPDSLAVSRLSLESQSDQLSQSKPVAPGRRKVRILSLDGGGIRGYSSLVILQELMHQIYVQENDGKAPKSSKDLPRPCDYFDLIGGNGTGGLIALMLGRMRMDIESCKTYYIELTRFVFITDKTVLGMPYGKTLFKASRLEEAIKHCVRESTKFDSDQIIPHSPPPSVQTNQGSTKTSHRRSSSWRHRGSYDLAASEDVSRGQTNRHRHSGNPDAKLLDTRDGACKTFVTTMLEGSGKNAPPVLLRSYPSPAESVPSYQTTIWQAGRATCATATAFKPITIDQVTFQDNGTGMYNPAFQVLDEAHQYEFPDCDIGVFVSVGTGKRTNVSAHFDKKREWWEGVAFEEFAEAKRRLLRRLDDCERVHRELVDGVDGGRPRLAKSGVATEDYYRLNVEVGVGEFGLNEWNRLSEVSTSTRRYLAIRETTHFVKECAAKIVGIEKGIVDDGSKVTFKPTRPSLSSHQNSPNDIVVAKSPSLHEHPYYLQQQKKGQEERLLLQENVQKQEEQHEPHQYQQQPERHRSSQNIIPPQLIGRIIMPDESDYKTPIVVVPPLPIPPKPEKPEKPGKVLAPASPPHSPSIYGFKRIGNVNSDTPNPEIRVTSPTTVAGDSDDENEDMYKGYGRRRRSRRSSRSRSRSRGKDLPGVEE